MGSNMLSAQHGTRNGEDWYQESLAEMRAEIAARGIHHARFHIAAAFLAGIAIGIVCALAAGELAAIDHAYAMEARV